MSAAALALKEHSMPSHVLHGEQNESIMNKWRCTTTRCWEMKMQAITQKQGETVGHNKGSREAGWARGEGPNGSREGGAGESSFWQPGRDCTCLKTAGTAVEACVVSLVKTKDSRVHDRMCHSVHEQINGGSQGPGQGPSRLPGSWTRAPGSWTKHFFANSQRFSQIHESMFKTFVWWQCHKNSIRAILVDSRTTAFLMTLSQNTKVRAYSRNHYKAKHWFVMTPRQKQFFLILVDSRIWQILADSRNLIFYGFDPVVLQGSPLSLLEIFNYWTSFVSVRSVISRQGPCSGPCWSHITQHQCPSSGLYVQFSFFVHHLSEAH